MDNDTRILDIFTIKNLITTNKIISATGDILYDGYNDNPIISRLLCNDNDSITKYINTVDKDNLLQFQNVLSSNCYIHFNQRLLLGAKKSTVTNILSMIILYNPHKDVPIHIMNKYNIMPDIYTYLFSAIFHSYEVMRQIGDRYFSLIDNVKSYNDGTHTTIRERLIECIKDDHDKLKYVINHDKIVIDILNVKNIIYKPKSYRFTASHYYHRNNNYDYIEDIREKIINNDNYNNIDEDTIDINNNSIIEYTLKKIMTKTKNTQSFHKYLQKYFVSQNRWDIIVSDSYADDNWLIYGSYDILKSLSDMLDVLKNKYEYVKKLYPKKASQSTKTGRLLPTPYSIHLFSTKKTEMKLSLFEKDRYNSNTFSCLFPCEEPPILEPVKYYTDTNIYRILDILDECLSFNGKEHLTNEITLTISHPKNIFDKYISSIITGIIPLSDSSFEDCVRFLMIMDEYPNRLLIMRHISPYVIDSFDRDITNGDYVIDDDICVFLKELCNNYPELKEFYFLIRQYERLSNISKNCEEKNEN